MEEIQQATSSFYVLSYSIGVSRGLLLVAEESPEYLIVGEINKDTAELTAVVRGYISDDEFPEMKIALEVVDQSAGTTIPASFSIARRNPENHGRVFFVRIPSGQFKPGRMERTWESYSLNKTWVSHTI